MKRIIEVSIAGRNFIINEDAYGRLSSYLENFRNKTQMGSSTKEVMDELEERIAEIFSEMLSASNQAITLSMVESVISRLGMPDGSFDYGSSFDTRDSYDSRYRYYEAPEPKKLFRDIDNKRIGGVCSGVAHYFNIDITIVRLIFIIIFFCGSFGFWLYLILLFVVPAARTGADKCRMYGLPVTAENIRRFH
ncbi:MAG: PspC domain-containing protein [Candidatus Coprenecus sp.]|nr:PspC domain-containing protein [Candidatus Coprenecus sp.]